MDLNSTVPILVTYFITSIQSIELLINLLPRKKLHCLVADKQIILKQVIVSPDAGALFFF